VIPLHVRGVGLFSPGFPGLAAFTSGVSDPAARAPRAEILPAALRRRATPLAAMVAEAAAQAAAQAGVDLGRAPFVLGSALGEIGIARTMLGEFREGEGLPSPTRFHNAVHNGPAAYVSIATGNRGFSTALAAGRETPAIALLEAAGLLAERGGEVLVVLADEPPPAPFAPPLPWPPAAVALALSAAPGAATRATLRGLRLAAAAEPRLPPPFAAHPQAGALALVAAVWTGAAGEVALGGTGVRGWTVEVVPGGPT
jgi:hypothetical protein